MDSRQLQQCLVQDSVTRHVFGGVLALDELPQHPQPSNKQVFVVNTQPASKPGAHWLAVYLPPNKDQPVEFFDALGQPPNHYELPILQFLETNRLYYLYQDQQIQAHDAITCGHFCLYYLIHRLRGRLLSTIIQDFSLVNYKHNEHMVMSFVHKYFNITV